MNSSLNKAPSVIDVYFEYENSVKTSYYSLELPDVIVDRVELNGILSAIKGMDLPKDASVAKWVLSQHGWDVEWRINGDEFLSRYNLVEIKCKQ